MMARMKYEQYTGGALMCNGYLVAGNAGDYVAVDAPGGFADWVSEHLPKEARLVALLLTHQHFDHVEDAALLQRNTGCAIYAGSPHTPQYTLAEQAKAWGIPEPPAWHAQAMRDSDIQLAGISWRALHIPGHAPDGLAWLAEDEGIVFTGDALFAGSVGRTDFPGGSMSQLVRGIREKLLSLPPDTHVLPGHGPSTSIGEEELNNPLL